MRKLSHLQTEASGQKLVMLACPVPVQSSGAYCLGSRGRHVVQCRRVEPQLCFRSSQHCRRRCFQHSLHNPGHSALHHKPAHPSVCHAAQPPKKDSKTGINSSTGDTASSSTSSSSEDAARKASNAAASTSRHSPASERRGAFSRLPLLGPLQQSIAAFLRSIKQFFGRIPAFIQREKLQRLHKKALDEPDNADR